MALKLAKAGYGNPEELLNMRADIFIKALHYEKFVSDLENAYIELNRK